MGVKKLQRECITFADCCLLPGCIRHQLLLDWLLRVSSSSKKACVHTGSLPGTFDIVHAGLGLFFTGFSLSQMQSHVVFVDAHLCHIVFC